MRHLPLLFLAGISISLSAQTPTATATGSAAAAASTKAVQASANATGSAMTQPGSAAASFAQGSNVSAQLTKKVDTKNAKVGDEVLAKTTSNSQLSDGTKVPKGTKLVGQVTEVQAKSGAEKASHLAFVMNKAVLHDGREIPMHAMLTSVSAPAAMASASDDLGTPMGNVSGGGAASGGGRVGGGSGLLGGTARTTGGVAGGAGSIVGNTASGLQSTTGNTLRSTEAVGSNSLGAVSSAGTSTAMQLNRVAVPNMPGVTLSSGANSSSSGALDAAGKNISLDSGTQMTMAISAN